MRISDWSSDVCPSDLEGLSPTGPQREVGVGTIDHAQLGRAHPAGTVVVLAAQRGRQLEPMRSGARRIGADQRKEQFRVGETAGLVTLDRGSSPRVWPDEVAVRIGSEERRVGKGCFCAGEPRGWTDNN